MESSYRIDEAIAPGAATMGSGETRTIDRHAQWPAFLAKDWSQAV
jgi:hypothetical protein